MVRGSGGEKVEMERRESLGSRSRGSFVYSLSLVGEMCHGALDASDSGRGTLAALRVCALRVGNDGVSRPKYPGTLRTYNATHGRAASRMTASQG